MAYQAEKILRDQADKVTPDIKSEVEGKVAALRSALTSAGVDEIRRAMNELSESMQKIGAAAYGQGGAEPPPGGEGEGGEGQAPPEEGTVEGEYREV
jgi:molecular chaperone DnaK